MSPGPIGAALGTQEANYHGGWKCQFEQSADRPTRAGGRRLGRARAVAAAQRRSHTAKDTAVYLTPGLDLPLWRIVAKGVADAAARNGAKSTTNDSHNSAQTQIQNAQDAIARKVDGIVISPTDSSTCPSVLEAA